MSVRGYGGRVTVTVPFGVPAALVAERLQEYYRVSISEGLLRARDRIREALTGSGSPVPMRSGWLRRSLVVTPFVDRGAMEVSFTAPYSGVVERGAEPHVIVPRTAKVLVFKDKSGKTVFAKKVDHPGYPGRGFAVKVKRLVKQIVRDELTEAFWRNRGMVESGVKK